MCIVKLSARSSRSLTQKAYRDIKEEILTGDLRPGDMVLTKQLAEKYGISRTPVHDALKMLCQEGLVEVISRVGYVISPMSVKDAQEIFDLRLALELLAVERAIDRVMPRDIEVFSEMEEKFRAMGQSLSTDDPDFLRRAIESHREFHLTLASLSGNRRLVDALGRLLDESERVQLLDPQSRRINFMISPQHRRIVEALAAGDRQTARDALATHIREAQQRIMRSLLAGVTLDAVPVGEDLFGPEITPADNRTDVQGKRAIASVGPHET